MGLNQDEAVNGVDAFLLGQNGLDHHGNFFGYMLESYSDWASPALTYLTIPFVKIFGLSTFTIRSVTVICSLISVFFLYKILTELKLKKSVVFAGTFLYAFSPFSIHLSRWAIPPSIVPFFLSIFIFILIRILNFKNEEAIEKKWGLWGLWFGSVLSGFSLVLSYPTMKLFAPMVFGVFLVIFLYKNYLLQTNWRIKDLFLPFFLPLFSFFSFLVLISPIYILTLQNPGKYNARFATESIFNAPGNAFLNIVLRFLEYFSPIFPFFESDLNNMHRVPFFGQISVFAVLPFCYGLYLLFKYFNNFGLKKRGFFQLWNSFFKNNETVLNLFLVSCFLVYPIAPALTSAHFMTLRGIHGLFLLIILVSISGNYFISNNNFMQKTKRILISTVIFGSILNTICFAIFYNTFYSALTNQSFNFGADQMVEFATKNTDNYTKVNVEGMYIYYHFYKQTRPNNPANVGQINDKIEYGNVPTKTELDNNYQLIYTSKNRFNQIVFRAFEKKLPSGEKFLVLVRN